MVLPCFNWTCFIGADLIGECTVVLSVMVGFLLHCCVMVDVVSCTAYIYIKRRELNIGNK